MKITAVLQRARIPFWDNARWLMLLLVVWGHFLNDLPTSSTWQHWLTLLIYLVHIPALIFISGYFASTSMRKIVPTVWRLLTTWLIFEIIWAAIRFFINGSRPGESFLVIPAWTLWFLVTLALLMLALPVLSVTRWPLAVAIVLALLAGLLPRIGADWSLSRTFYFLPVFVVGWMARERGWLERRWFSAPRVWIRLVAGSALTLLAVGAFVFNGAIEHAHIRTWVAGYLPYASILGPMGIDSGWGILIRAATMLASAMMVLGTLLLISRRTLVITKWGGRTLYIYLLHTFVVYAVVRSQWFAELSHSHKLTIAITSILAALLTIALSTQLVRRATRPIIEPSMSWLVDPTPSRVPEAPRA